MCLDENTHLYIQKEEVHLSSFLLLLKIDFFLLLLYHIFLTADQNKLPYIHNVYTFNTPFCYNNFYNKPFTTSIDI